MFSKRYTPETNNIFQELKNIRQKNCVSLERINRETKISLKYLRALEEGNTQMLPDVLYIKNIIKKYLAFFNIDAKPYLVQMNIQKIIKQYPERIIGRKPLLVVPRLVKTALAAVLVLSFIGFLGYKINKIFIPPRVLVYSPGDGISVGEEMLEVRGKTEKGALIFINSEQVLPDKNGGFKKEIDLQKGLNIIKISGVRKYSKENIIWRNVVLEIK